MGIENIRKEMNDAQDRLEIVKRDNPDELEESWESEISYLEGKIYAFEFALMEMIG